MFLPHNKHLGKVVEWFKALVLKTSEVKASVGSNPTLSARGISSVGRAPALQAGCQEFESPILHHGV
jgi:hypothetical protein